MVIDWANAVAARERSDAKKSFMVNWVWWLRKRLLV